MQSRKILYLLAICFICVNARVIKRQKRVRQRPVSYPTSGSCTSLIEVPCGGKSISEPTYGGLGTCNCQNMFLDELSNYVCGCKYVDIYDVMNPERSNFGRVPAIKLPNVITNYDAGLPMPAINLPGLYDLIVDLPCQCPAMPSCQCKAKPSCQCQAMPSCQCQAMPSCQCQAMPPCQCQAMPSCPCQAMPSCQFQAMPSCQCQAIPPYIIDLPSCPCQSASYQIIDSPCSCISAQALVDYLASFEVPSPILQVPYAEPFYIQAKNQPQAAPLPSCGCSLSRECECQNMNMEFRCDSGVKVSHGLPCGYQNPINCGCQNVVQYGPQFPALEGCQLSPVELPVYGYGCQSLPPVVGCEGKYLHQVTLQPPFL